MIQHHPEQYKLYSEKEFTWENIHQKNRNLLLWRDPSVDGIKTGHTEKAGYCLVASAAQDDMRLISVVMGTESENARASESEKLLTFGFRNFDSHEMFTAGSKLETTRVWKGESDYLDLGTSDAVRFVLPKGQQKNLSAQVAIKNVIEAPIKKGQALGVLTISLKDKTLLTQPVVALNDVKAGSLFKQLLDSVKLFVEQLLKDF
jgi:D-alanyl-D-alanine carboxypeptidase (penicillin-binding protein 5/6)